MRNKALQELETLTNQLVNRDVELKKTYETLTLALTLCSIGVWDLDIPNNILKWDSNMIKIFNRNVSSYEDFLFCLHDDDRNFVSGAINKCLKEESRYDNKYRINTDEGIKNIHAIGEVTQRGTRFTGVCVVIK